MPSWAVNTFLGSACFDCFSHGVRPVRSLPLKSRTTPAFGVTGSGRCPAPSTAASTRHRAKPADSSLRTRMGLLPRKAEPARGETLFELDVDLVAPPVDRV